MNYYPINTFNQRGVKKIRRQLIRNKTKILIPLLLLSLCIVFSLNISIVSAADAGSNNMAVPSHNLTIYNIQTTSNSHNVTIKNSTSSKNNRTLPDPVIYNGGVPVSRGGQPAGYNWGTIQNAINAALSGDTIMLENGATFYEHDLIISRNVDFNVLGGGHSTIDAQQQGRIFYIYPDVTVNLYNLTLQNGYGNGGAIYNFAGTLTVNNCTFTNNHALEGGAIYNNGGTLTVTDSTFTGNTATSGGTIYNNGGSILTIISSSFTNNTATDNGGAIYNIASTLNVTNGRFTNNTAQTNGGAIYNPGTLTVYNSTFTYNTATGGGAIFNYGIAYIHFNSIVGNTAHIGNAIYHFNGTTDATNNWWGSNTGPVGKIFGNVIADPWLVLTVNASPNIIPSDSTSTVTADLQHDNHGNSVTGGHVPDGMPIIFQPPSAGSYILPVPTTLTNGQAQANYTSQDVPTGPVTVSITVDSETQQDIIIIGGTVTNTRTHEVFNTIQAAINDAQTNDTLRLENGATFYEHGLNIPISLTFDVWNTSHTGPGGHATIDAQQQGTIFYINPGVAINLYNLTLTNVHSPDGGAIYNNGTLNITSSTFTGNTATNGGAIYNNGTLNITSSTFENNHATHYGGAIYTQDHLSVTGSRFTGNTAQSWGGAIDIDDGILNVTNSTFTNNTATSGGAIINWGTLNVTNSTFTGNTATDNGGAITNPATLNVINSTFAGNTATNDGGAIFNGHGTLTVTDSTFTGNSAQQGGAIWNYGTLTVTNSTFTSNTATDNGGAIYNNGTLNVTNSSFTNNTTGYGGAIVNLGTLTVTNCTFTGNTAKYYGGAICNWGSLKVTDSDFTDNQATETGLAYGGAIFNSNIPVTISKCTFEGNIADYGGAIYNQSELTITESDFTGNAADAGGAIYNDYSGDLTINKSEFTRNNGGTGGAIYNVSALSVSSCSFRSNNATYGGAIYNEGNLNISKGSIFSNNTAEFSGGAIRNYGGTLNISDTEFKSNAALDTISSVGGAIYNFGNGLTIISDCIFTDNSASYGGAIDSDGNDLNISGSTFTGNTAQLEGGAIRNYYYRLNVTNSTFTGNSAQRGGAIWNHGGAATSYIVNFNRIVGNSPNNSEIYSERGTVDARLNWWGSNTNPEGKISTGTGGVVLFDPWIILTVTANPTTINYGGNSQIKADLLHDSNQIYHNPADGHVPDGILITFTLNPVWGNVIPVSATTSDGRVEVVYSGNGALPIPIDPVKVYANVDSEQNVYAKITIIKKSTSTTAENTHNYAGKKVKLTAHVHDTKGNPINEGTVRFTIGKATPVTANVHNGLATCNWTIPTNWKSGTYTITAHYLGTANYNPSTGTATLTVNPSANLNFTKTVSSGTHYYGDTIHYYLTVKNNGPDSATGVSVFDQLPTGLSYKSSSANIGSYKLNTSIWTIGILKAGQTAKLDITAIINKIGTIKNTATLTQNTYPQTPVKKSVSFKVSNAISIAELIKASRTIKNYYESNKKLPASLKVAGQTLTMPQLLKLLTTATINISKKNLKPISVTAVGNPSYPGGKYRSGKLYNYLTVAQNIKNIINNKGRAPNYAATTLGNIPFSKLVYMYAKVINFYGKQNRLPYWVATYKI